MNSRILSVDNLSISFPYDGVRLLAVRGASLHIDSGETLAIVGESGCGKSALARAVMGLTYLDGRIDSGTIRLMGKSIGASSTAQELADYRRFRLRVAKKALAGAERGARDTSALRREIEIWEAYIHGTI